MKRLHFRVVTAVLVILTMLTFLKQRVEPFIPPLKANRLEGLPGEYLEAGAHQGIDWYSLSPEPFRLARQTDKLVLLVIGTPWSRLARQADSDPLVDTAVQEFLQRSFVCVRVDAAQNPRWLTAFLPVTRLRDGLGSGFQVWVLDPKGKVMEALDEHGRRILDFATVGLPPQEAERYAGLDHASFLARLISVRSIFADDKRVTTGEDAQTVNTSQLETSPATSVHDFSSYAHFAGTLSLLIDHRHGGIPWQDHVQNVSPWALDYLWLVGSTADARAALDPVLNSPLIDIVDGGRFRSSETLDWRTVNFDKPATTNAAFIETLNFAEAVTGDKHYAWFARAAFDDLMRHRSPYGLFYATRVGDEQPTYRSAHSSVSPRRMRELFDGSERQWLRDNVGLRVETNSQMIPFIVSPRVIDDPMLNHMLDVLRANSVAEPAFAAPDLLDVSGYVAARLIHAARFWGDQRRLEEASKLVDRMSLDYVSGEVVVHRLRAGANPGTYLGDYLAFSDAALEDYLATGRLDILKNGLGVLQRAVSIYAAREGEGYFINGWAETERLGPANTEVPEISDTVRESTNSAIIRLLSAYGRLLGPTAAGRDLMRRARTCVDALAWLEAGTPVASYFCAAAQMEDSRCAIAVGSNAVELANSLARLRPTRLVAPAGGPIGATLPHKPGIYLTNGVIVQGPFTVPQAAERLPLTLSVGVSN